MILNDTFHSAVMAPTVPTTPSLHLDVEIWILGGGDVFMHIYRFYQMLRLLGLQITGEKLCMSVGQG